MLVCVLVAGPDCCAQCSLLPFSQRPACAASVHSSMQRWEACPGSRRQIEEILGARLVDRVSKALQALPAPHTQARRPRLRACLHASLHSYACVVASSFACGCCAAGSTFASHPFVPCPFLRCSKC